MRLLALFCFLPSLAVSGCALPAHCSRAQLQDPSVHGCWNRPDKP